MNYRINGRYGVGTRVKKVRCQITMTVGERPGGVAFVQFLQAAFQGNEIDNMNSAELFVEGDMELRGHVTGTWVVYEGDGASMQGRVSDVDSLPAAGGPCLGCCRVVLINLM